ncbi:MAG: hypothetical protein ACI4QT_05230 [Kiritimatiellia bacterium]
MKNDPIKNLIHEAAPSVSLGEAGAFWARFLAKAGKTDLRGEEIKSLIREGVPELRLKGRETFWADFRGRAAKNAEKNRMPFWRYRGIAAGISAMAAGLLFCLPLFRPMSAEAGGMSALEIRDYRFYESDVVGASVLSDDATESVLLWAICDDAAAEEESSEEDTGDGPGIQEIRSLISNQPMGGAE